MIEAGKLVEEIATGRPGRVTRVEMDENTPFAWHVSFTDNKAPGQKRFTNADELRVLSPQTSGGPGITPEDPIGHESF